MTRARIVSCGLNWMMVIIQPRCAIEEYARIFRSCVWFRPPHPPTITDSMPNMVSSCGWVAGAV